VTRTADNFSEIKRRAREIEIDRGLTDDERRANRYAPPCTVNPNKIHEYPNGEELTSAERWTCMHCGVPFAETADSADWTIIYRE
jgi:hypothetical protein